MLLFVHKCINYGYVARYAYAYRYLFTFRRFRELFVKQNSNTFLSDLKQFSEITNVRQHKRV